MAGPIARRPNGLLDLLLTQQQGRSPRELGDIVTPVIDMQHFYETDRLTTAGMTITVTASNTSNTLTIPSGEVWNLKAWSCRGAFATVNQVLAMGYRVSSIVGGQFIDLGRSSFAPTGATDQFADGLIFENDLILPPGTKLTSFSQNVNLDAQANIGVTAAVLYVRMEV